jgi:hypothetical protein
VLGDVDLGELDAESDYKLAAHFVTTPHVNRAVAGRGTIFIRRRDQASQRILAATGDSPGANGYPRHTRVVELTPDAYAWAGLMGL